MSKCIDAPAVAVFSLLPSSPFHFDGTVRKPSHFPSPDNCYEPGRYWQTLSLDARAFGVRLSDVGSRYAPEIEVTVFSERPVSQDLCERIGRELSWRFDLDMDIKMFCTRFRHDPLLSSAIRRWRGMRVSCAYSLYELLVVTIVLQNATVRRTHQMLRALLERYGTRTRFDGKELLAFWTPQVLDRASEDELRVLRVGYRARSLKRVTAAFVSGEISERAIRSMDKECARRELLKLYGIGPASVWYLLFELFHHYDALDSISPWEQKIYSKIMFGDDIVPAERIAAEAKRRWGSFRMLALHYLFEDLFWRREAEPIPWLDALTHH